VMVVGEKKRIKLEKVDWFDRRRRRG